MRVTSRAATRSARARWGARCVGLGLTTALAVTLGAGPASAQPGPQLQAEVAPTELAGNPDCVDIQPPLTGFTEQDTDNAPVDGETLNFTFNGSNGSILLSVTDNSEGEPDLLDFDISGPFAAAAVIVKGGPNANVYDYRTTMAGQIEADETLHSPLNTSSAPPNDFYAISHVAFCIVPDGDNT
ncbi:hypothetical protein ACQF36_10085 [Streptomyces sp. Marseille-Q5077]|uniref:hypothetical protein n=1 Tax=unclassified Streptomyces TaxID=2593676 RepID=UPI003681E4A1